MKHIEVRGDVGSEQENPTKVIVGRLFAFWESLLSETMLAVSLRVTVDFIYIYLYIDDFFFKICPSNPFRLLNTMNRVLLAKSLHIT